MNRTPASLLRRLAPFSGVIRLALVSLVTSGVTVMAADRPAQPVNLLFIITDQQRWDALGAAGNPVLRTPHLDALAEQGARFSRFYAACPVCVPARTTILTGQSPSTNAVTSNGDVAKLDSPAFPSFDQILLRSGYRGEYHGKFHSPYRLALDYTAPVRWLNGPRPPGSRAALSEAEAFRAFIDANVPKRALRPGELVQRSGPYTPIPLDENYGKVPASKGSQSEAYGRVEVPADYSIAAFTAREGLEALDRLKDGPFTLTVSLNPPHPPMMVSEPYYSRFPPSSIPLPPSLNDPLANSPYAERVERERAAYRDPENIRQLTSIYYGMVAEIDDWVGRILARLDELGLARNTLVVFTSDHGETLGEHGLHGKFVFYEGSVRVPLLLRLPGVIPARTVINAPASHVDLFPTILDYLGRPGHPSEGRSLRPLIERRESGEDRIAVSEWPSNTVPGFMLCDGRWKFLYGRSADASSLDALYDLQADPQEMNNLIGRHPDRESHRAEVVRLKGLLVEWLTRTKSPHLEGVKARAVLAEARTPARTKGRP